MTFESHNDRELWVVKLGKCQFPVYCRQGKIVGSPVWHVVTALPIKPSELNELNDFLASHSRYANRTNFYLDNPERVAFKASGITPEFYYVGSGDGETVDVRQDVGEPQQGLNAMAAERYAKYVFNHLKLEDWDTFRVVYSSIFSLMPAYLLRTMEPVDIGWAKLVALPFRANWKQILLAKFPGIATVCASRFTEIASNLAITDFAVESRKTDLLAVKRSMNGQHFVRIRPEIIPSDSWSSYANKVERSRMAKTSLSGYVSHVGALVEKAWPFMLEAFVEFLRETRHPCGNLSSGDGIDGMALVPAAKVRGYDPRLNDHRPVHVVTQVPTGKLYPLRKEDVGGEITDLPDVPPVQPDTEDLRDAGDDADGVAG